MKTYSFRCASSKEFRHALEQHDPALLDEMIRFLEDDPYAFWTGYTKQRYWRYVRRFELSAQQVSRLEDATFNYLQRLPSREFRAMCVTMSFIGTDSFWKRVQKKIHTTALITRLSASCLYTYSEGAQPGEDNRQLMQRLHRWTVKAIDDRQQVQMYDARDLLEIICQTCLWHNKHVSRKEPELSDLPIIEQQSMRINREFASLVMEHTFQDDMLTILKAILGSASVTFYTRVARVYALYLLYRLNDARGADVVIRFLERCSFFGLEIEDDSQIMRACFSVLRHYDTPEARQTIEKYSELNHQQHKNKQVMGSDWLSI